MFQAITNASTWYSAYPKKSGKRIRNPLPPTLLIPHRPCLPHQSRIPQLRRQHPRPCPRKGNHLPQDVWYGSSSSLSRCWQASTIASAMFSPPAQAIPQLPSAVPIRTSSTTSAIARQKYSTFPPAASSPAYPTTTSSSSTIETKPSAADTDHARSACHKGYSKGGVIMRKVIILLLMCLFIFPSMTFAKTSQTYTSVPLCEMTPYKFLDRIIINKNLLKASIYDIHKSAKSGEIVSCKIGSSLHYCHILITSGNLSSGLTRLVLISCNDSSEETSSIFTGLTVITNDIIGLSYQEALLLLNQDVPSPYGKSFVSSIWKDNRRIISWYEITSSGKSRVSFYAVSGPRYIR